MSRFFRKMQKICKVLLLRLLGIYQRYISVLALGSCRYYPTCSEYAKWCIQTQPLYRAPFSILFRILRCSKVFDGGIDYPVVSLVIFGGIHQGKEEELEIDFWFIPDHDFWPSMNLLAPKDADLVFVFKGRFFVIKCT